MIIFDAHLHIIDRKYPLIENNGYLPNYYTRDNYLKEVTALNVVGGAIVSGSFQGYDQTYLIDTLTQLGDNFVGVTQLPYDTPDEEIIKLDQKGIKALRFNMKRGGSEHVSQLDYFARRVHELVGWHTELYIDSSNLPTFATIISELPAVSIDHLGLTKQGLNTLFSLVDKGVKVKATGFGRINFDPIEAMQQIYRINPDALMFGTDLPSTRAKRPFHHSDIELITNSFEQEEAEKILYKNASHWYLKINS